MRSAISSRPRGGVACITASPLTPSPTRAEKLGVEVMGRKGIVGRGVLLDIAALKGGPLAVGSVIMPGDLEAAEAAQGVTLGEGDILFVRNGAGTANTYARGTGLHAACLPGCKSAASRY
jgi:hypothetical protein